MPCTRDLYLFGQFDFSVLVIKVSPSKFHHRLSEYGGGLRSVQSRNSSPLVWLESGTDSSGQSNLRHFCLHEARNQLDKLPFPSSSIRFVQHSFLYYTDMWDAKLSFKQRHRKVVQQRKWIELKITGTMALIVATYVNVSHLEPFVVRTCSGSYYCLSCNM